MSLSRLSHNETNFVERKFKIKVSLFLVHFCGFSPFLLTSSSFLILLSVIIIPPDGRVAGLDVDIKFAISTFSGRRHILCLVNKCYAASLFSSFIFYQVEAGIRVKARTANVGRRFEKTGGAEKICHR